MSFTWAERVTTCLAHVRIRGTEDLSALEDYALDRVARQAATYQDVIWCEVDLRGRRRGRRTRQYVARITAHFGHTDVCVRQQSDDAQFALRDAFDALGERLSRMNDVQRSRPTNRLALRDDVHTDLH